MMKALNIESNLIVHLHLIIRFCGTDVLDANENENMRKYFLRTRAYV